MFRSVEYAGETPYNGLKRGFHIGVFHINVNAKSFGRRNLGMRLPRRSLSLTPCNDKNQRRAYLSDPLLATTLFYVIARPSGRSNPQQRGQTPVRRYLTPFVTQTTKPWFVLYLMFSTSDRFSRSVCRGIYRNNILHRCCTRCRDRCSSKCTPDR